MKITRFLPVTAIVLALFAFATVPPARAADRFWTNAAGGNFNTPANWVASQVPGAADSANFTNNASYQVNWTSDAATSNAFFNARSGTITQAVGNFSWLLTNSFVVGQNAGSTASVTHVSGELRVTNAASNAQMVIGQNGRGTYQLSGTNASVVVDQLFATNNGNTFSNSFFNFSQGRMLQRSNSIIVIPKSSVFSVGTTPLTASSWQILGGTNVLLGISNSSVVLGGGSTASVQVVVSGPGTVWSNNAPVVLGGGVGSSTNSLTISNGATVFAPLLWLGNAASSSNNVLSVSGGNSRLKVSGQLQLQLNGQPQRMLVDDAATVECGQFILGDASEALVNGLGTSCSSTGLFSVSGQFIITNQAMVSSFDGMIVSPVFAMVTDSGSLWTNRDLSLRFPGARLMITNGARVVSSGSLEMGTGAGDLTNQIVVTGSGSELVYSTMIIGQNAAGASHRLVVENGARLRGSVMSIGSPAGQSNHTVIVTGSGTTWSNSSTISFGGNGGSGHQLHITDGASVVQSSDIFLGDHAASVSNRLIVAGGSLTMNSSGADLFVGDDGSGNSLLVTNGGVVIAANLVVGSLAGSSGNSVLITGSLIVTNAFASNLDVRRGQLSLSGGSITARRLLLTNSSSVFDFPAGVLNVQTSVVNNAQTFLVGNGTDAATLNLTGNGTHSYANGLTIRNNSALTGNGTVIGTLTVESGATLSSGASVGQIILSNSPSLQGLTVMEISKIGPTLTNDEVRIAGPFTNGGTLTVTKIGPTDLREGNRFQLFVANSYAGSFSSVTLPPLNAGLTWSNNLAVDGSIQVVSITNTPLQITGTTVVGTNFLITGSGGAANGNYQLLTSTNVALPLTNWTPVFIGRYDCAGDFGFSYPINSTDPQRFFVLSDLLSLSSDSIALVDEDWSDGNRNQPAPPIFSENGYDADFDGDLESAWFSSPGAAMTASPGLLFTDQQSGASSSYTTYFAPEANPITLSNPGEQLKLTWEFAPLTVNAASSSQGFRLALVDSAATNRVAGDSSPQVGPYLGYAMFMNMKTGNLGNANSFQFRKRTAPGTPASFLVTSGDWLALTNGATTATPGYADATVCEFIMTLTRNTSNGLEVVSTMYQPGLGGVGTNQLSVSYTDQLPDTFSFDTFGIRPSSLQDTAQNFITYRFKVEFICDAPPF